MRSEVTSEAVDDERNPARPARHGLPRRLHPQRRAGALGRPAPGAGRSRRAARHRHGGRPPRPASRPRSSARAWRCCRRACCSTSPVRCRAARPRSSSGRARATWRSCPAPRRSTSARCAPRTSRRFPEPGGDQVVRVPDEGVRGDRGEGRAVGVARRDAADPHRHPRLRVGIGPADGRDGLLPPLGEGDRSSRRRWTAPSRRTCRPARCRSSCASPRPARRASSTIGVRANQVVFDLGGRRPLVAAHRRSVPELPPAAARHVRARADGQHAPSSRTSCGA